MKRTASKFNISKRDSQNHACLDLATPVESSRPERESGPIPPDGNFNSLPRPCAFSRDLTRQINYARMPLCIHMYLSLSLSIYIYIYIIYIYLFMSIHTYIYIYIYTHTYVCWRLRVDSCRMFAAPAPRFRVRRFEQM